MAGLVIGKFMPLHKGHMALINFAVQHCGHLIVLVGARKDEPIPGPVRYDWVRRAYADDPRIRVDYTDDDLPDAPQSDHAVSQVWARYLAARYPQASVIFSSEQYGEYLAGYMGIEHVPFDPQRTAMPVSGEEIRNNPMAHWAHIPDIVRPYFVKRVCIYGPESTGKTLLTEYLARRFNTAFVPEMARVMLSDRMPADEGEMQAIAELHAREIIRRVPRANKVLFVDTDHITTWIYWQEFFGRAPEFAAWIVDANRYDLYLLLDIDVPWVADPLRECGDRRKEHFRWFKRELDDAGLPYVTISGNWEERKQRSVAAILERWPELAPASGQDRTHEPMHQTQKDKP